MRLLLDTHAMLWYVDQEGLLSRASHAAISDPANDLLVSAASIWELAIKIGNGKLALSSPYRQWITQALSDLRASLLPITVEYADVQATLPKHHGDPFDRLLIAQAIVEGIPIVSGDSVFDQYALPESGDGATASSSSVGRNYACAPPSPQRKLVSGNSQMNCEPNAPAGV